ncbi:MAG: hypothetical protein SFY80_14925 [Verrucomicrobiota bacterium]|nr:hypothetical protein [Verrucomicrobiota bacterium]
MYRIFTFLHLLGSMAPMLRGYSPDNQNASIGMNLAGVPSYADDWTFVDAFKIARNWWSQRPGSPFGEGGPLNVDADGWVISLDGTQYAETVMLDAVSGIAPAGTYVMLYEGEGTFTFSGNVTSVTPSGAGRILLNVNPGGNIWLRIMSTNPANYPRNIRIILPGFENSYASQPFDPGFIQLWKGHRLIRFMDWMATNGSLQQNWSQRNKVGRHAPSGGVPLEDIVRLCNTLQCDGWINIPHQATDDYIKKTAILFRTGVDMGAIDVSGVEGVDWQLSQGVQTVEPLSSNLKLYLEYSNEVWNGMFDQATYAGQQGVALGLAAQTWEAAPLFYARRSKQLFQIFEQVFGGVSRLQRVLAWQVGSGTTMMDFENAYQYADCVAYAPYFGGYLGSATTQDTVSTWTVDQVLDACEMDIARSMATVRRHVADATARTNLQGKPLRTVCYEAGQHLVGTQGAENNLALTALFHTANRAPRMGDLYRLYLNSWRDAGGAEMCIFSSMGGYSKWGSWGVLENHAQDIWTKPKYAAIRQFMSANLPWWESSPPPAPPVGTQLLNFLGSALPAGITQNRAFVDLGNPATTRRIDFSTANGGNLFNCPGYPLGQFYGGYLIDYSPNPYAGKNAAISLDASTDRFTSYVDGSTSPSKQSGVFLWRRDQFSNPAEQRIGKLAVNFISVGVGRMRFVIRNGSTYYISSYMANSSGLHTLTEFNASSNVNRMWKVWNPTATDFDLPAQSIGFAPMSFDNITEVGFAIVSERPQYGHNVTFNSFQAWALDPAEFTATINRASTQPDPTISAPIKFVAQFSHPTANFTATDLVLGNDAGSTSATVTEIAPNDGTTYEISISGMNVSGQVSVSLPAGACTNTNGYPNRAATGYSSIVRYNQANAPTVTLNQAAGQPDPAAVGPITFTAVFSEPVSGFVADDVVITGTAGATTAAVVQISPNNGTTYQISISGMTQNGTVFVTIPSGRAISALGAGNAASTSMDNSVSYDTSVPPDVTINQATTQEDPAFTSPVRFLAVFTQPVSGFDATDLLLGGTANPTTAVVTELSPNNATRFEVAVSGMPVNGTVTAAIPAGVCAGGVDGTLNRESNSTDNSVQYYNGLPTDGAFVDFRAATLATAPTSPRNGVSQNSGQVTCWQFGTNDASLLFSSTDKQARVYGGVRYDASPNLINSPYFTINAASGYAPYRFNSYMDMGVGKASRADMLLLWRKDNFANNMERITVGFDNDIARSSLTLNLLSISGNDTTREVRFVVRNGTTYYASEFSMSAAGTHTLTGFNNSTATGKRWAIITPTADSFALPQPLGNLYAVQFDDVQEVGIAVLQRRTEYGMGFQFDGFTAKGIAQPTPTPPAVGTIITRNGPDNAADGIDLGIQTVPGKVYTLYQSTDLIEWTPSGQVMIGDGSSKTFTAPPPTTAPVFYRIGF